MNRRLEVAIFCAFAAAWTLIYALIAPPFGGTDIFIFKDAGANLALGHGFQSIPAPYFDGDPGLRPFASYTPLYPLLYGLWGKLFGIGAYASGYFDLALGIVASWLTLCLLLPAVECKRDRVLSATLLGIAAPAGAVFMTSDRPELLGYAMSAALFLLWPHAAGSAWRTVAIIGASAIVFLAHPFAGLMMLAILSMLLMTDQLDLPSAGIERVRVLVCGWMLFAFVCATSALSLLAQDRTALRRFLEHAAGRGSGAGILRDLHGPRSFASFYLIEWRQAFLSSSIASLAMATSLLICLAIAAFSIVRALHNPERAGSTTQDGAAQTREHVAAAFILAVFLVPLLLFPRQNNYYVIGRALVPLFVLTSGTSIADRLRRARLPLVLICTGILFAAPQIVVQVATRAENRASYEAAQQQMRATMAGIDPSQYIAISPVLYPLVKPTHPDIVDVDYLDRPDETGFVEGLILARAGTRFADATRVPISPALTSVPWQPLNQPAPPVFIRVFGRRAMRAQWGWGFDAYRR